MLNQLIESTNVKRPDDRRRRLMAMSFLAVSGSLVSVWTYSLFAKQLGMPDEFDMAGLVAPVAMAQEVPAPPKVQRASQSKASTTPKKVVLPEFYDSVGKTAPQDTTGQPNVKDASKFDQSLLERGPESIPTDLGSRGNSEGAGLGGNAGTDDGDDDAPPVRTETPRVPRIVSGGVVNGKALSLVKPGYPAMAKAVRAGGDVNVEVVIDENGNVVSARAVSGHPLLRDSAERAARSSRFSPTMLSNQAVKVSGIIVYRFTS